MIHQTENVTLRNYFSNKVNAKNKMVNYVFSYYNNSKIFLIFIYFIVYSYTRIKVMMKNTSIKKINWMMMLTEVFYPVK